MSTAPVAGVDADVAVLVAAGGVGDRGEDQAQHGPVEAVQHLVQVNLLRPAK